MRALLLALLVAGLVFAGCAQLGNYGTPESPTAPPIVVTTPTPAPTAVACIPEGETLGAVVPDNFDTECCPGLVAYIPDGIVGTRGTCMNPNDVPKATPTATPTESGNQLANPAAAHCVNLGYSEAFQDEGTQCLFTDGSACDEWDFYRGTCGQSFSACVRNNGELTGGSGRIGTAFFRFGLCTFADGSQCGEAETADGTCIQGQCKTWTAKGCQNP